MTVRRILVYALTVIAVAAGSIMLGSNPASASTHCSGITRIADFTHRPDAILWHGSATGGSLNCENTYDDRNLKLLSVIVLQESLNFCYGPNGQYAHLFGPVLETDGKYGQLTTSAVRNLQTYLGVGVDGRAGPQTRTYMAHYDYQNAQCTMPAIPIQPV